MSLRTERGHKDGYTRQPTDGMAVRIERLRPVFIRRHGQLAQNGVFLSCTIPSAQLSTRDCVSPFSGMRAAGDMQHFTGHERRVGEIEYGIDDLSAPP